MIRLKLYTRKKNILLSYLFRVFYSVCSIKENLVMMKNSSRRMYTFFSYLMLTKSFRYVKLLRPLFQPLYNSLQGAHDSLMSNKDAGNKRYFYYVVELQLRIIIIVRLIIQVLRWSIGKVFILFNKISSKQQRYIQRNIFYRH